MNEHMVDPRDITEKTVLNSAEDRALKHLAAETGLSKSTILRIAFLKLLRERHETELLSGLYLSDRPLRDKDLADN